MREGQLFYEELDRRGLTQDSIESLLVWSDAELWEFIETCAQTIPSTYRSESSLFEFVVNDQLSGMPSPCAGETCRIRNAISLGRFAALYADHVVLRHPFEGYIPQESHYLSDDGKTLATRPPQKHAWPIHGRKRIITDVKIALYFRSLVEAGRASFTAVRSQFCAVCIYELLRSEPDSQVFPQLPRAQQTRLADIVSLVYKAYETRTTAVLDRTELGLEIRVSGDDDLVEHGERTFAPDDLETAFPELLKNLPAQLSFEQLRESRALHEEIERIADDMLSLEYYAEAKPSYLTSRGIDREVLEQVTRSSPSKLTSSQVSGLSQGLPYVSGLSIKDLLALRNEEEDAFQVYRDAVTEVLTAKSASSEKELAEALKDRAQTEINRIERSLKNSRRVALKSVASEVAVTLGGLTIGLFSGFLPTSVLAAIGALSTAKTAATKGLEAVRKPKDVLDNRFYFLWKARELALQR